MLCVQSYPKICLYSYGNFSSPLLLWLLSQKADADDFTFRISASAWLEEVSPEEPSWDVGDTIRLAPILAAHGVDLLDVSAGGIDVRQKIRHGPEYQVPFAAGVKASQSSGDWKLLVASVGNLGSGPVANAVIESGRTDVVFVGREFLKNPGLVWKMAEELGVGVRSAKQIDWTTRGRARVWLGSGKVKA